jgi:hypothetical protein
MDCRGADTQFIMVGNWNSNGRTLDFLLHDNVATTLSHLDKAMFRKDVAYLTARKHTQSTQP